MEPRMNPRQAREVLDHFRVEEWYPALKQWTFETEVVPLTLAEALVLTRVGEHNKMKQHFEDYARRNNISAAEYNKVQGELKKAKPAADEKLMSALRTRLDTVIQRYVKSSGGAFVKLSTRSPKDAALTSEELKVMMKRDIEKSTAKAGSQAAEIEDMRSFIRACSISLKVQNADQAIALLLRSSRTYQDLMLANLIQGEEKFDMQLHVREWVNIDPEWEFRTFITNNEMHACTQYYSLCYVPEMVPVKDAIRDKIYTFWKENLRALPYFTDACKGDYTVDFVLSPDLKVICVIEVNNPPPVAGTSLFVWDNLDDRAIIHKGPFTFRILEKPLENPKGQIAPHISSWINHCRGLDTNLTHKKVACNGCRRHPISENWYHCRVCTDFDFCDNCFEGRNTTHNKVHTWLPRHTCEPSKTP